MRREIEGAEQATLMEWAALMEGRWPELKLLFHVPNGGARSKSEAGRMKRQGVKAGVPDLVLPVARGGYHGLYLELKAAGGRPTPEQKEWIRELQEQGYASTVAVGWEAAAKVIETYLCGKRI